jgi:hypothetical protein
VFPLVILSVVLQIVIGCNGSNRATPNQTPLSPPAQSVGQTASPTDQQKKQEQTSLSMLRAAICRTSIASKTFVLMPWDEKTKNWKKKSLRTLNWTDDTQTVITRQHATMKQLISHNNSKDLESFLNGFRGMFYVTTLGDMTVIQKVQMVDSFDGESFTGGIGSDGSIQLAGPGQPVSCGR